MSYGKTSGSSSTTPITNPIQMQQLANQQAFGAQQAMPSFGSIFQGAGDLYNQSAGGVNQAATNYAQTANALSQNLGQGGAGAYATGINALSNISSPEYQQAQLQAAMFPAQQQYAQNIAAQGAQFGGAGQLGSARQALAGRQLAGLTQQQQQQASANVLRDITQQQLAAGQALTGAGIQGGQLGLQGAQAGVAASQAPMAYLQQLANLYGSVPQSLYTPTAFGGTYGQTTTSGSKTTGIQI